MIPLVDLKKQYSLLADEIDDAIKQVLKEASFINGRFVQDFEQAFALKTGAAYGIGTSSGTTALHLALQACGLSSDDEVITVPNTFIATVEAIQCTGARIGFCNVSSDDYLLDPQSLEKFITPKTKAIIPVNLFGQCCDLKSIQDIAQQYDCRVIIDAAQSHNVKCDGREVGQYADAVCYSFYPGKNLGAYGDAGMVTTNDDGMAKQMKELSNHGRSEKYEHHALGFNYRMDDIQAAVLKIKLKYLDKWTQRRKEIANLYHGQLKGLDVILPIPIRDHVYHLYVIRLNDRDFVKGKLKENNIATGIHYPIPLHCQQALQDLSYQSGDFPFVEKCSETMLSLPIYPEMTDGEVQTVVSHLKEAISPFSERQIHHV